MQNMSITDDEQLNIEDINDEELELDEEIVEEEDSTSTQDSISAAKFAEMEAKLAQREAEHAALQQKLEQFSPLIEERERQRANDALYEATTLIESFQTVIDNSEVDMDGARLSRASELMKKGIVYELQGQKMQQEQLAADAITLASNHLGADATIGQLRTVANKLVSLGDSRLMAQWIQMQAEAKTTTAAQQRTAVARTRTASGVDSVVPAPTQSGGSSSFKVLEQKMGDGTASRAEEALYEKMYERLKARGSSVY